MKTVQLPPGADSILHWSGESFKARPNGKVDLPDNVARDYARNGVLKHYDVQTVGTHLGLASPDDPACCNRTLWEWEESCPKCGAPRPTSPPEPAKELPVTAGLYVG